MSTNDRFSSYPTLIYLRVYNNRVNYTRRSWRHCACRFNEPADDIDLICQRDTSRSDNQANKQLFEFVK